MDKTLYDLSRLEEILDKTRGDLSEVDKAAYYAAANTMAQTIINRWKAMNLNALLMIETEIKDLMWHMNTVLGFMQPIISVEGHFEKAKAKLASLRHNIEDRQVIRLEYHRKEG